MALTPRQRQARRLWMARALGLGYESTTSTLALSLLSGESAGFAISGEDMSAAVKGHTTNFNGNANDLLTYTSPDSKWVYNSSGILYESSGQLPQDYDPSTNAAIGLLVEAPFTRYGVFDGEDFTTWLLDNSGATNPVVTANYAASPSGTLTADRVVLNKTGGAFSRIRQSTSAAVDLDPVVLSVWAYTVSGNTENIGFRTASNAGQNVAFTGSWQRHWTTDANGTTQPLPQFMVWDSIAGNDEIVDAIMWGVNVGKGTYPTSYVPTSGGAAVTRAADNITLAASETPWNASGNVVTISARTALGSGTQVFFQADDGSENNRVRIERNASNEIHCIVTVGGAAQCDLNLGAVANKTDFAVSFGFAANDFSASLNGGTPVTDASGTIPTITTLRFGSSFTGEQCDGWIRSVSVVPAA